MKSWGKQGLSLMSVFVAVVLLSEWAAVEFRAPEGAMRFRRLEKLDAAPPANILNWLPSFNSKPERTSTPDSSLLQNQSLTSGRDVERLER